MQDSIVKTIDLKAPIARVWRALTDHQEFGEWFRVDLDGPFEVGKITRGKVTYPGCEHLKWETTVRAMEPERLFSFTWYPVEAASEAKDAEEPEILVEFKLEPTATGTHLVITESGFSKLPEGSDPLEILRRNTEGWDQQAKNIAAHVES